MRYLEDLSLFKEQTAQMVVHNRHGILSESGFKGCNVWHLDIDSGVGLPVFSHYWGKINTNRFYFQRRKKPDYLAIEFILSGKSYLRCGNRGFIAEAGDLCLMQPHMEHDVLYIQDQDCKKYAVAVSGEKLVEILKTLDLDDIDSVYVTDSAKVIDIFEKINKTYAIENPQERLLANGAATLELFQLIYMLKNREKTQTDIDIVIRYFEKNLHQKINMSEVAKLIDKKLSSFTKLFKDVTRITPYQYLINIRMQHAKKLLKTKQYSIKEVADMIGYSSPSSFNVEFKRFYGFAPSQMLKCTLKSK